jgi:hypothetical protein
VSAEGGPIDWVQYIIKIGTTEEKREKLEILFTFWWMI